MQLFYSFPLMIDLLAENPPCIHSLITADILNSFERFEGSLPSVFDAEGLNFCLWG